MAGSAVCECARILVSLTRSHRGDALIPAVRRSPSGSRTRCSAPGTASVPQSGLESPLGTWAGGCHSELRHDRVERPVPVHGQPVRGTVLVDRRFPGGRLCLGSRRRRPAAASRGSRSGSPRSARRHTDRLRVPAAITGPCSHGPVDPRRWVQTKRTRPQSTRSGNRLAIDECRYRLATKPFRPAV